jgi:hypothetical protein
MLNLDAKGKSLVVCGIFLAIFLVSVAISYVHSPGIHEFQFHRSRYEHIVANAKSIDNGSEDVRRLWMSSDLDPATLARKRTNNEDMQGMVEVFRNETTGAYIIIITTLDQGHFGTFGYAYADTPNSFKEAGMWQSESKIDAHWSIAANRSW